MTVCKHMMEVGAHGASFIFTDLCVELEWCRMTLGGNLIHLFSQKPLYPFTDKSSCEIQKTQIDIGCRESQIELRNWGNAETQQPISTSP